MIPVLEPAELRRVDAAAAEAGGSVEALVEAAGAAVAREAVSLLGGSYGRRIVVVAGRGNNGADGRVAARRLAARGALVRVVDAGGLGPGEDLPPCDLVVDAAYGTGLGRPYTPPRVPPGAAVVAVDIPSGVDGLTGRVHAGGGALRAEVTVTFAAMKPGLLLADGPALAGDVRVADIGLGALVAEAARAWLVTDADVAELLPARPRDAHKWQSAVAVVAGSPGMYGAPWSATTAAFRAGAGYVRLGIPGVDPGRAGLPPTEAVLRPLPEHDWVDAAVDGLDRCAALLVGPGLGHEGPTGAASAVGRLLGSSSLPAVVDADGLAALGDLAGVAGVADGRSGEVVLTPHAGEYARLTGAPPGDDRVGAVRDAAAASRAVVLLKGSTTVVAHPDGRVLLAASGSSRLATAGTGDVLSGVVAALLARGLPALEAAALGAHVHGRAASIGRSDGLMASDLPDLVSEWLSSLGQGRSGA